MAQTSQRSTSHGWQAWKERLQALRNIPPLAGLMWQAGPRVVLLGLFSRIAVGLVPIATLDIGRLIIDHLVALVAKHQALPHSFWWLVVLEFGCASVGTIFGRITDYADTVLADRYTQYISVRVMEHASNLDLVRYEDPEFYDKLERARVQATDRLATIRMLGQLLQQVITAATLIAGVIFYAPWLLLILVIGMVPAFLGESHFAFLNYALKFAQTPFQRQLDYLRVLGASKSSAKELKLFGLGSFLTGEYRRISDQMLGEDVALAKRKVWVTSFLSFISTAAYYSTYALVIYWTIIGRYKIGTLYFLIGAISGASSNIQSIFSTFSGIADQAVFLNDLLAFFKVEPVVRSKPNALPAPRPMREGFEFRNVSFAYPGTTHLVLRNLSFTLKLGERIALIGENGQGKTTIVKLITRLYDPTAGQILLDGVDLREYNLEDLAREIGVVFQDFMRYEMTAQDNIATGRIEKRNDTAKIIESAKRSGAHRVIEELPDGYSQVLGRRFEGGIDLSGGQWQKLALARAYLRDAQLLILDEPTAALDARAEHEVFHRFAELTLGKMAILISHRFSTVRMADRILVLDDGKIAEEGSHGELVQLGGRYAQMFELQASNYR